MEVIQVVRRAIKILGESKRNGLLGWGASVVEVFAAVFVEVEVTVPSHL